MAHFGTTVVLVATPWLPKDGVAYANNDNNISMGLRMDWYSTFLTHTCSACLALDPSIASSPWSPSRPPRKLESRVRPFMSVVAVNQGLSSRLTLFLPFVHTGKEQLRLLIDIANA